MGLFYTTFTVYGPEQATIVSALRTMQQTAFVSPTVERYTVVYERRSEEQDFSVIEELGKELSSRCNATVLAAVVHDDDVLYLWLFQTGECRDFYNSLPQYFDADAEHGPPEGGDGKLLSDAFGQSSKLKRIESLLRANLLEDELPEISGELERHQALLKELGMPPFAAEVTYSSIAGKYLPEEYQGIDFSSVGDE